MKNLETQHNDMMWDFLVQKRTPKVIKNIHAIKKLQVCEFGHFCEKFTSDDPSKLIG